MGHHRGQHALQQRFAGLAVATGMAPAAQPGQLVDGRRRRPQRRREIDVRKAQPQGRNRVKRAGRQGTGRLGQQRLQLGPTRRQRSRIDRRLGRGHVDHHDVFQLVFPGELVQVVLQSGHGLGAAIPCGGLQQVQVSQLGDRRPDVAHRAGPNPPVDAVQLGAASLGQIRVGRAASRPSAAQPRRPAGCRGFHARRPRNCPTRADRGAEIGAVG